MRDTLGSWKVVASAAIKRLAKTLVELRSREKILLTLASDFATLALAAAAAQLHSLGESGALRSGYAFIVLAPCAGVLGMLLSRSYRRITRYPGASLPLHLGGAMLTGIIVLGVVIQLLPEPQSPRWPAIISFGLFGFIMLLSVRVMVGATLRANGRPVPGRRVVIYGAGEAGAQLLAALRASGRYNVTGFVDDDKNKWGRSLSGLPIYAPDRLPKLKAAERFDAVLLAIPSATRNRRRSVLSVLESQAVHIFEMPSVDELVGSGKRIDDLREIQVEDLLGREPVVPNEALIRRDISGRIVLVTGAGGSIGSELCRQALQWGARKLILLDNSEFALYRLEQELASSPDLRACELVPVLGTVLDQVFLTRVLRGHAVDTVYHAAAYKHVPLVEKNISNAVGNNVLGMWRLMHAAQAAGVRNFILISTDKAVRPTSVMGASKRVCEQIAQICATRFDLKIAIVRFGNVLNSSGSVVPLFRAQIAAGEPVTVTHREVTRYFMTIREAAQLVIQAGAMGTAGEVFVLDMGVPVKIYELAERMIHLSGLQIRNDNCPDGDIEIQITGLRPGEKLYEELLLGSHPKPTEHPRIFVAREAHDSWRTVESVVAAIQFATENGASDAMILAQLSRLVDGFIRVGDGPLASSSQARVNADFAESEASPEVSAIFTLESSNAAT